MSLKERGFGPVDLSFHAGELTLLCGLSGSGKSTLCQLLAGIQEPTAGTVTVAEWEVGYVAHDFESQLLGATVFEELQIGARASLKECSGSGCQEAREALEATFLDRMGLDPLTLSAALQQQLILASLVRSGARCLVLDESMSHLDPVRRRDFGQALQRLRDDGFCVILVSHQPELLTLADRVVLMERGLVAYDGRRDGFDLEWYPIAGFRRESEELFLERVRVQPGSGGVRVPGLARELTAPPGTSVVLGGYSGAGKSKGILSLAGLEFHPEWGHDFGAVSWSLLRQHVGPSFWRHSCREELRVSRAALGELPKELETAVMESLPASWLERAPWQLSHGQLRFFGVCCLLLQCPQVLYLDQPFQGLDGSLREKLRYCLAMYLNAGGRVFLTTHEPGELPRLGHLAIWLSEAGLKWAGVPSEEEWGAFALTL